MLLNAYGWWKVSQITYIASLVMFSLATIAALGTLLGLTIGRKPQTTPAIHHETITPATTA
jgi:hypothetical protein